MINITRVHRRWLGPLWPATPVADDQASYSQIHIHTPALRTLEQQMTSAGHWRGGLLFGHVTGDILHVTFASPAGYRWWNSNLLVGDARYALGWADALVALDQGPVDWVGSWLISPTNALLSPADSESWAREAAAAAVVDSIHPLVTIGWSAHRLHASAYQDQDGTIESLPVSFKP